MNGLKNRPDVFLWSLPRPLLLCAQLSRKKTVVGFVCVCEEEGLGVGGANCLFFTMRS